MSLIKIDEKDIIMAIKVDINLNLSRLVLLMIGLLYVSAGAFLHTLKIHIEQITALWMQDISTCLHIRGTPIKIIVEAIQHIQLLVACNPKEGVLIML